jgi:hypothetical protein
MTPEQIHDWWCCQDDEKRASLVDATGMFVGNPFTTPRAIFDVMLDLHGFPTGSRVYDLWVATFQVAFVGVEVDGVEVEFVEFFPDFWTAMVEFSIVEGFPCPEPCYVLKFARSHI